MSDLQTVENIKIPYPVEGVIRTAQLDDTIAPRDSVQLAVNMNFDRVGTLQTRLGVSQYATALAESISNFGTLRNSIIPDGYSNVQQLGDESPEIVASDFLNVTIVKVSDTKIAAFWTGASNDGFCSNFTIDEVTGAVTPLGTPLEFDTGNAVDKKAILINSTHVLLVWQGVSNDGFVQAFNVLADSIVAEDVPLEFDTGNGEDFTLAQIDSTHFICFYQGTSGDGIATVFEVDTGGAYAVTEPGSPLTFESGAINGNACVAVGDGTHFINFWRNASGAQVQCFTVNTGTWAITAEDTPLNYATNGTLSSIMDCGDGEHFVNVCQLDSTAGSAQAFELDTGTFAVTEVGTPVTFTPTSLNSLVAAQLDENHFVAFYSTALGTGFVQMLEMNLTTFDISEAGPELSGYTFADGDDIAAIHLTDFKVMVVWGDTLNVGNAAMFQSLGDVVEGRWLYAGHGDEVSNWDGATWTVRRSGLAQVSKPRFSQYLNYIWMVNGNEFLGGNSVATSDGGDFGTDLVPEDFPAGDFIHAGFEGRVWVVNKTLGIIYYTDIVQFIPPSTFVLTFNPDVNFISNLTPQTGQSITGLYRVPRALLVFTEDSIYRIYGATSVDAYPAYNVGTFSQESIVETKTGIFFHHSSGFYQFDYGSQPVEISRRIIDFVKAIPRSYYPEVKGVYDNFDCVEWDIGPVTVEGVAYASCVLRYTISTQVWTIYDYSSNLIRAMISYDDGTDLVHLMGTSVGKVGAMDVGYDDFGAPFYFEFIDRWRGFTEMYYQTKSISGFNVYSENAAGANLSYQKQKSGPNAWQSLMTVTDQNNSLSPNTGTEDFDVIRLRLTGNTSGTPVVVHGIEITQLTIKGQEQN